MKKDIFKSLGPILKWVLVSLSTIIIILFITFIIIRFYHFKNLERDQKQIDIIHSTKIDLKDVTGENLPGIPESPDETIGGVDINSNGIRDDVELAIFGKYPDSAKTRAALLQYAYALQKGITQNFLDSLIATEISREISRGAYCIGIISGDDEDGLIKYLELTEMVRSLVFNSKERVDRKDIFFEKVRSYSPMEEVCDIDYSLLTN